MMMMCSANPHSKAYIPFRTDPYDQPIAKNEAADFRSDRGFESGSRPRLYEPEKAMGQDPQCPLRFSLGVSRRSNDAAPGMGMGMGYSSGTPLGIHQPPIIYPVLPWQGPGRQVLYATQYEHLDLLTPMKGSIGVASSSSSSTSSSSSSSGSGGSDDLGSFLTEGLIEHLEFPLLFESSAFQTSPVIADANGDGILDAILTDYHGGVYAIGLQMSESSSGKGRNHRYFLKAQVPRLYVRRQWIEATVNETLGIDPYEAEKAAEEAERRAEEAREAARAAEGAGENESENESKSSQEEETPRDRRERFRANDERPYDPYHSYFEYSYGAGNSAHEPILRGVTASLLGQDKEHVEGLAERRNRQHHAPASDEQTIIYDSYEEEQQQQQQRVIYDSAEEEDSNSKNDHMIHGFPDEQHHEEQHHQQQQQQQAPPPPNHRRLLEVDGDDVMDRGGGIDDEPEWRNFQDDFHRYDDNENPEEGEEEYREEEYRHGEEGDGEYREEEPPAEEGGGGYNEGVRVEGDDNPTDAVGGDDQPPMYDDDGFDTPGVYHDDYRRYDDFYSGRYNDLHEDYFDDKHYIRLPPHILCTPVVAELPKMYGQKPGEIDTVLFVAVSYFFDEDEYEGFFSYKRFANSDHGDETETKRGMYTANAIMMFHFGDNPRWGE